jgi:DNA (cytosine-5)-methyltransferase 1
MRVLNLYAGIGGNRKLWKGVEVDAVELNPDIAAIYTDLYPMDNVIVGDAHNYLEKHFDEYDFIWTSPPCQTHSRIRQMLGVGIRGVPAQYPDMRLYQEIIFLQHNAVGRWVVENVIPYYEPLIRGKIIQRHMFWSNFPLPAIELDNENLRAIQIPDLVKIHGIDLTKYDISNKRQILRNCVDPRLGSAILDAAMSGTRQETLPGALA